MAIFLTGLRTAPTIEAEKAIIPFLDVDAILTLSTVSKNANAFLNNNYFQKLFKDRHRALAGAPHLFQNLQYFHPEICWKAAAWVLDHPNRFLRHPCFYGNPLAALATLQKKAKPFSDSVIRKTLNAYEAANKKLLSFHAKNKPFLARRNARLDNLEAWVESASPDTKKAFIETRYFLWRLLKETPPDRISPDLIRIALLQQGPYAKHFFTDDVLAIFCEDAKIQHEKDRIEQKVARCKQAYEHLAGERKKWKRHLPEIQTDLQCFQKGGNASLQLKWKLEHHDALVKEVAFAREEKKVTRNYFLQVHPCREIINYVREVLQFTDIGTGIDFSEIIKEPEFQILRRFLESDGWPADSAEELTKTTYNLEAIFKMLNAKRASLEQHKKAMTTYADDPYRKHLCQLISDPLVTEDEDCSVWYERKKAFVTQLLPEDYLNNPERNKSILTDILGLDRYFSSSEAQIFKPERIDSKNINLLVRDVERLQRPHKKHR